jgi:hypothetical protein
MNRKESKPPTVPEETNPLRRTASFYKRDDVAENGLTQLARDEFFMADMKQRGGQNALDTQKNLPINKSPFYKREGD